MALRAVDDAFDILEASSLHQAFDVLSRCPDVGLILLDLDLEDSQGLGTLKTMKEWCDSHDLEARVVVLSGICEPSLVTEVVDHYATGFIVKATSQEIFKHAIALTLAGGVYIPELVLRQMVHTASRSSTAAPVDGLLLTARERAVAALLVRGHTYKRIARELERLDGRAISEHTVRAHVGNIAWKLGVTENAKAGVMAEIARRQLTFPSSP